MEERSLRITGTNTNFFNRLTKTLTKLLIPTKIGINGMLITLKRNNLIKAFENYKKDTENYNTDELEKKYDDPIAHFQKRVEQLKAEKAARQAPIHFTFYDSDRLCIGDDLRKKLRLCRPEPDLS